MQTTVDIETITVPPNRMRRLNQEVGRPVDELDRLLQYAGCARGHGKVGIVVEW